MKPDWKDAPAWAKYLACDGDGAWWWYDNKPRFSAISQTWGGIVGGEIAYTGNAAETLEARPEPPK